jgi:hypothetical protein
MVEKFVIETKDEADEYLKDLLGNVEYRSMDVVISRANNHIKNDVIKNYFIKTAEQFWKNRSNESWEGAMRLGSIGWSLARNSYRLLSVVTGDCRLDSPSLLLSPTPHAEEDRPTCHRHP